MAEWRRLWVCAAAPLPVSLPPAARGVRTPEAACTPESAEENSFCSLEDFEGMVGDLRRTFISWLRHTEAELKRERNVQIGLRV